MDENKPWTVVCRNGRPYEILAGEEKVVCWGGIAARATKGKERARRLVAAVNAVAGIPTEALESGALAKALDACVALHEYEQTGGPFFVDWDKKFHAAVDALRALGRI